MNHLGYIVAAYLVTLIALAGLAGWLLADMAGRRRELKRLEEAGHRRRSERREAKV